MRFRHDERDSPWLLPTQEELLDINFWSIVSDLRSAVRGTLVIRTLGDYSSGWNDYVCAGMPETRRKTETMESHAQWSERIARKRTPNPRVKQVRPERRAYKRKHEGASMSGRVRRMMHLLISNGMSEVDARNKAKEVLLAPSDPVVKI